MARRRRHTSRRPGASRSAPRRRPAHPPAKPARRWRGPLIGALTVIPVGLGLATALVLLASPVGGDRTGANSGSEGPDSSASPDDFFAAPDDAPTNSPTPTTDPRPTASSDGGASVEEPPASTDEDDAGSGGSGGSDGSGGGSGGSGSTANAVVDLVNDERASAGCDPVRTNDALTQAAEKHSKDMASQDYMAHESPDGTTPDDRAQLEGYDALSGENVAAGHGSPEDVMTGWMNSEGHRENILDCDNEVIGVGEHQNRWTQMFGSA